MSAARQGEEREAAGGLVVERNAETGLYRAINADTGEPLSCWQRSPGQALTGAENLTSRRRRRERRCLRCGRGFASTGPGHRLCSARCRTATEAGEEHRLAFPR